MLSKNMFLKYFAIFKKLHYYQGVNRWRPYCEITVTEVARQILLRNKARIHNENCMMRSTLHSLSRVKGKECKNMVELR